ncbi:MAG: hypothetical protein FWF58_04660 [Firmicutes bacterium]|nr:hypothetical protein [Bacillota bacterium]
MDENLLWSNLMDNIQSHFNSDDYSIPYSYNYRVVKFNHNFIISFVLLISVLLSGGIIGYNAFLNPSFLIELQTENIAVVQVGEFEQLQKAQIAADNDFKNGGAGYVHLGKDGIYRVYSKIVQSVDSLDNNQTIAYFERSKQNCVASDKSTVLLLHDLIDFPMQTVYTLNKQINGFGNYSVSYGKLNYLIEVIKSECVIKLAQLQDLSKRENIDNKVFSIYKILIDNMNDLVLRLDTICSDIMKILIDTVIIICA